MIGSSTQRGEGLRGMGGGIKSFVSFHSACALFGGGDKPCMIILWKRYIKCSSMLFSDVVFTLKII